jgi:ssDNA-binding replication factor A large subunit
MPAEQTIEQILSEHPEISKEEIIEKLEREKQKTNGFISDETLLRMIAAELGMEMQNNGALTPTLSVVDLIPNLNNVTVIGRVVAVFQPKTFNGNRSGKFASFLVADENGILRVVLWNDKTSIIESGKIKVGQIVRISHGYTKEGPGGKVELHIGEKCEVEIDPQDVKARNYPTISKFTMKIGEITHAHKSNKINVVGTVKKLFSTSTFEREDSSLGRVMRFLLTDETGEISAVVWNEKVDELEGNLKEGIRLQVVDARVRKALNEGVEIHVDAGTYVELLAPTEEFSKIASLREGLGIVNIEGEVVTKPMFRDVKTPKGEGVKVASFELKDETGRIWVSTWRNHAETVKVLKVGDRIIIKDAYVRRGFSDQLEISTRDASSVTVVR